MQVEKQNCVMNAMKLQLVYGDTLIVNTKGVSEFTWTPEYVTSLQEAAALTSP